MRPVMMGVGVIASVGKLIARLIWVLAIPLFAAESVTVEQLEQKLNTAHEKRDKDVAKQLSNLELTERLSSTKLAKLQAGLPGEKSRLALLVLGDASAFLPLPCAELLATPAPPADMQQQILSRASENLAAAIHKLPDFFARKTTTRFHDLKVSRLSSGEPVIVENQPFQFIDADSVTVHYENGQEVEEAAEQQTSSTTRNGLMNRGIFGPVLRIVVNDIFKGKVKWNHWEQHATRSLAVFRYSIPRERSHYIVSSCCFGVPNAGPRRFESTPAYHGEIAVDPATGSVYRLVLITELAPGDPISQAQIMVEYEPLKIGGNFYICPRKSVAVSTATVQVRKEGYCMNADCIPPQTYHPKDTAMNDTVYDDYHVFRSESKILP